MENEIQDLDPVTTCLLYDAAKRKGASFGKLVINKSKVDLDEIAGGEYAQQQIDDKLTGG